MSLSEFIGAKNVALYFYPKDFARGCTTETKSFGDSYGALQELRGEALGVSSDSTETQGVHR